LGDLLQAGLQLQTAHPPHPHIEDQAALLVGAEMIEILLGRAIAFHPQAHRFHQELDRFPHLLVVIHDVDGWLPR
jgi:hypothetical protein